MSKGCLSFSHTGRDLSHHVTAELAETQKTIPKLSPPTFLFLPALFFAESLKFPSTLVTRRVKGKLAALQPIVTAPYETQGFQLHFLPADLIEVLHVFGISSCPCRVQNTQDTKHLTPRCLQPLLGMYRLCEGILMKINYSQHNLFSKFPVVGFMSCQPNFAEGLKLVCSCWLASEGFGAAPWGISLYPETSISHPLHRAGIYGKNVSMRG